MAALSGILQTEPARVGSSESRKSMKKSSLPAVSSASNLLKSEKTSQADVSQKASEGGAAPKASVLAARPSNKLQIEDDELFKAIGGQLFEDENFDYSQWQRSQGSHLVTIPEKPSE